MLPIRILILYVTAGAGHRRAAEALEAALRTLPGASVECRDVLAGSPDGFHRFYEATYLLLVRHFPWIWQFSYAALDAAPVYRLVQPLRRRWNLFITRRMVQRVKADPPDIIVAAHFLPADVFSAGRRAGWLRAPLAVVVTDLHPHWFWISPEADAMVVSTPEGAETLVRRGVRRDRIHVIGIPVGRAFGAPVDRPQLQARFGLEPDRRAVLVTSGGTTVGSFERVVHELAALEDSLPGRLQLLVVCGEDEATRRRLEAFAAETRMPVKAFGFVDYMADLMGASDLIVAKAGGLTVSEAMARGLPLVLYHIIPGQERMNALYAAAHGAAVIAPRPGDVARTVARCLQQEGCLAKMAQAARSLGRPSAGRDIIERVIRPLVESRG